MLATGVYPIEFRIYGCVVRSVRCARSLRVSLRWHLGWPAVKETLLLMPVQRQIGRIQVEYNLARRAV